MCTTIQNIDLQINRNNAEIKTSMLFVLSEFLLCFSYLYDYILCIFKNYALIVFIKICLIDILKVIFVGKSTNEKSCFLSTFFV